ncbi:MULTISPECIES: hypothetical protein [unclassified Bradyrhizobium]|uniref:hypothetical protein n=1 Tax=unclassified Bradyrhizobium TaxID=2631580 RepID=UPI0028E80ED5|nr:MULTISPECIES: hypothetical protein [unclassified Bradyrhizobium]
MKKLLFVLYLALGGCASIPVAKAPVVKQHRVIQHHVAPVITAPVPAPVEVPKPKHKRWLDFFKKDRHNG